MAQQRDNYVAERLAVAMALIFAAQPFTMALQEPGAPWNTTYAVLAGGWDTIGIAMLLLAARACLRAWQALDRYVGWRSGLACTLAGAFSFLLASGPLTMGIWHWWTVPFLAFGSFAVVLLVRMAVIRVHGPHPPRSTDWPLPSRPLRHTVDR